MGIWFLPDSRWVLFIQVLCKCFWTKITAMPEDSSNNPITPYVRCSLSLMHRFSLPAIWMMSITVLLTAHISQQQGKLGFMVDDQRVHIHQHYLKTNMNWFYLILTKLLYSRTYCMIVYILKTAFSNEYLHTHIKISKVHHAICNGQDVSFQIKTYIT